MKVLITGVAGLLGSRLANWIVENNKATVYGVDDLSGGYIENINPKVKFLQHDLTSNTIKQKPIHLIRGYHHTEARFPNLRSERTLRYLSPLKRAGLSQKIVSLVSGGKARRCRIGMRQPRAHLPRRQVRVGIPRLRFAGRPFW